MRHKKKINHLGRQKAHRDAMMSNMAVALILNKRIHTTVAKAKALRGFIEPLITKSKDDTTHSRRIVFSYLQDKKAVTELFRDISLKVADRPGGYTRILKSGMRMGDSADMCYMELVDYNELMLNSSDQKDKKTSKRRRSKKGKVETEVKQSPKAEVTQKVSEEVKPKEVVAEDVIVEESIVEETVAEEAVAEVTETEEVQNEDAPADTETQPESDESTEQEK